MDDLIKGCRVRDKKTGRLGTMTTQIPRWGCIRVRWDGNKGPMPIAVERIEVVASPNPAAPPVCEVDISRCPTLCAMTNG